MVSISYALTEDFKDELHQKIRALRDVDVVFIAAGGNSGLFQPHAPIPACFEDSVISVGALDAVGAESPMTSDGRIDVFAPGENITEQSLSGTSYAAPAIAGLVLLLKQWAKAIGHAASDNITSSFEEDIC